MALWAYTPLLSGSYTRLDKPLAAGYEHPGTDRRLAMLDEIAAETGTNRNRVVLAWLAGGTPASHPGRRRQHGRAARRGDGGATLTADR